MKRELPIAIFRPFINVLTKRSTIVSPDRWPVRIISGFARGCKLATPPNQKQSIRPTADRAREGLFNILQDRTRNALVLDLFAGTGAIGLEAFSRGASSVVFVDRDRHALRLIDENIRRCSSGRTIDTKQLQVIQHDLSRGLPLARFPDRQFDLIFADPPYDKEISLAILKSLHNSNLLSKHGVFILEERRNVVLPEQFSCYELTDQRKYGEAGFWFYRLCENKD